MRLCTLIVALLGSACQPAVEGPAAPQAATAPEGMIRIPGNLVRLGRLPEDKLWPKGIGPSQPPPTGPLAATRDARTPARPVGQPPPEEVQRAARSAPLPPVARDVAVSAFYIDATEVSNAQYAEFLQATGYRPPHVAEGWADEGWNWQGGTPPAGIEDHAVILISWYDAREYCAWAGKRLPTEAEWQLAVLGSSAEERRFPWGEEYRGDLFNHGRITVPNYDSSDGWPRTSPVGSYPEGASRYGVLDGFGNAWEWCADTRVTSWDQYLGERDAQGRLQDPHTHPIASLYATVRGGSYFFEMSFSLRGERNAFPSGLRRKTSGFRCARSE